MKDSFCFGTDCIHAKPLNFESFVPALLFICRNILIIAGKIKWPTLIQTLMPKIVTQCCCLYRTASIRRSEVRSRYFSFSETQMPSVVNFSIIKHQMRTIFRITAYTDNLAACVCTKSSAFYKMLQFALIKPWEVLIFQKKMRKPLRHGWVGCAART